MIIIARRIYPIDYAPSFFVEKLVSLYPKFNPVDTKITKKAIRKFFIFEGCVLFIIF